MKVLVTGGNGFIGGWVRDQLAEDGHSVIVMDHQSRGHSGENEEQFLADVRDATAVTEAVAHCDGVIHLAAVLGTQETIGNPQPSAETNILGSLNVFEAANQYKIPVVYAGVGNHWMRNHGTGSYTISKTAAEDYARMHNAYRGSEITIVRPVNAYGPRQSVAAPYGTSRVRKIMPAFICRALTGTSIEIYGDGTQVSDCVYVADVARVFVRALEKTALEGHAEKPIEVGPAESDTVLCVAHQVAHRVAELTGEYPVDVTHLPMRPGEVPNAVVNADTATLEWLPDTCHVGAFKSLGTGITDTIGWFAENWLPGWLNAQR